MKRGETEFKKRSHRKKCLEKSLLNYIFITMASPIRYGQYNNLHIGGKAEGYFGNMAFAYYGQIWVFQYMKNKSEELQLGMTRNSDVLSYSLGGKLNQHKERKGKMDNTCFFQVALKRRHHSYPFGAECQSTSKQEVV